MNKSDGGTDANRRFHHAATMISCGYDLNNLAAITGTGLYFAVKDIRL
jgi:hypothetical protein